MGFPQNDGEVLVLHNPNCSKSRAVLELLQGKGIAFEQRRYLKDPLSRAELEELRRRLGRPASEWIRTGQKEYGASGLGDGSPEALILDVIAVYPALLERPIVIRGMRAAVGRPPEKVLELFDSPGAAPEAQG